MSISIEAISFNHDPVSAARDALTIRRNASTDITAPEWRRGTTRPEDSPAAYTIDQIAANRLTIKVEFRREAGDPASVQVHAVGNAGNVLGNVKSRTITFGNKLSAVELFELDTADRNPAVAVSNIAWDWFVDGTFRQTTEHRIYTIVSAPQEPWGQPGSPVPDFQLPWTEVLEHACREARGARTANEAADLLTRWVYSLGQTKLRYDDYGSGSSTFTIPGMRTFRCTYFLEALAGSERWRVNCTDCATILSSFANILGCDLTQSQIGNEFYTNPIQKIGSASTIKQPFKFHEVAWKFPAEGAASVYDCCLQVDGDADPTDNNFSRPTLGINMPLGLGGTSGYHYRLIAGSSSGQVPGEKRGTRMRRKIDGDTTRAITLDPQQHCRLAKEHKFSDWEGKPKQECFRHNGHNGHAAKAVSTSDQQLFLKNYSLSKSPKSFAGFTLGRVETFKSEPDPFRVTEVVWSAEGCHRAALRVLTYECSSVPAARSFLLTLLGGFNLSGIERRTDFVVGSKKVKVGDVAFAGPDDLVLLFARANNVVLIQNVGHSFVPVSEFAHAMDSDMTSSPDPESGYLKEMEEFQVYDKQIRVGDEVRIHTKQEPVTKEKETLFKVFAPAGDVFLKGDELLYRSRAAGEQTVTILARKPGGETTRQVLDLYAEIPETNGCKCYESNIKEESVMPDVTGVWSSRLPTNEGDGTDMTVDGIIYIQRMDAATGLITGQYKDPGPTSPLWEMTGHVNFSSDGFYTIDMSHPVGSGVTRHYEGKLATFENSDHPVQIVAGKYYDTIDSEQSSFTPDTESSCDGLMMTASAVTLSGGQDNGTWVATKP
jgi:hypothetical protein